MLRTPFSRPDGVRFQELPLYFVLSTKLIREFGHTRQIRELTFLALATLIRFCLKQNLSLTNWRSVHRYLMKMVTRSQSVWSTEKGTFH